MKVKNCIMCYKKQLTLGAIFFCQMAFLNAGSEVPDRYKVIFERAPFGNVASNIGNSNIAEPELTEEQQKLQAELEKEAELLGKNIKLTAITTFKGVPAAGIIELNSKRTYYLTKGQSILGYTLTDIGDNSILLETTNAIASISMSYAPGQPGEISIHPISGKLSPLNIFDTTAAPTNSVVLKEIGDTNQAKDSHKQTSDGLELSEEVREAVTVKDADGTERISFRELHRLRMEERKRKLEEARLAREEKELAEKKAREEEAQRQAEMERILVAEEQLLEAAVDNAIEVDSYNNMQPEFEEGSELLIEQQLDGVVIVEEEASSQEIPVEVY